jgi:signal transduction histidine kinase
VTDEEPEGQRAHLSRLQSLLLLAMLMAESGDQDRIIELAGTAVPSLSRCRLVGIYLTNDRWGLVGPAGDADLLGQLAGSLQRLGQQAGAVPSPAAWAWAYPMRSSAGHAGHLVVAAESEPAVEERFILHALAQQTGVVLVNAQLQVDERAAAMRALQHQAAELTRFNAELEQLTSITAHELSEPLRSIAGFAQLLQRHHQQRLGDDADQAIRSVIDGARRMRTLLDGVLAYAQSGQRRLTPAPVELEALARQVAETLRPTITATRAQIHIDPLPCLHADPVQLGQVLQHLLANALQFRGDRRPHIQISAAREQDGWRVSVSDNGIGIDPVRGEEVFRLFRRLHAPSEHPGTGVGLAICRRIVQRHGGRIWVEPRPQGGSVFHFTIPDTAPGAV